MVAGQTGDGAVEVDAEHRRTAIGVGSNEERGPVRRPHRVPGPAIPIGGNDLHVARPTCRRRPGQRSARCRSWAWLGVGRVATTKARRDPSGDTAGDGVLVVDVGREIDSPRPTKCRWRRFRGDPSRHARRHSTPRRPCRPSGEIAHDASSVHSAVPTWPVRSRNSIGLARRRPAPRRPSGAACPDRGHGPRTGSGTSRAGSRVTLLSLRAVRRVVSSSAVTEPGSVAELTTMVPLSVATTTPLTPPGRVASTAGLATAGRQAPQRRDRLVVRCGRRIGAGRDEQQRPVGQKRRVALALRAAGQSTCRALARAGRPPRAT